MSTHDHDLEAAIEKVKKEIQAAGLQPPTPPTNEGRTTMAAKKKVTGETAPAEQEKKTKVPVDGYTVEQLATELNSDSVTVRKGLRDLGVEKPGTRWVWAKKSDTNELKAQLKEWLATDGRQGNGRKTEAEKPAKSEAAAPAKKSAAKKTTKPAAKKTPAKKSASA